MYRLHCIVLTGGPGGGKTSILNYLLDNKKWRKHCFLIPEVAHYAYSMNVSPTKKEFQYLMVNLQLSVEDCLSNVISSEEKSLIVCDRGSLDPLAYWLAQGWSEEEFFRITNTKIEQHYQRYFAVVHMATVADQIEELGIRWDKTVSQDRALLLDLLLQKVWKGHEKYFYLQNKDGWDAKLQRVLRLLIDFMNF